MLHALKFSLAQRRLGKREVENSNSASWKCVGIVWAKPTLRPRCVVEVVLATVSRLSYQQQTRAITSALTDRRPRGEWSHLLLSTRPCYTVVVQRAITYSPVCYRPQEHSSSEARGISRKSANKILWNFHWNLNINYMVKFSSSSEHGWTQVPSRKDWTFALQQFDVERFTDKLLNHVTRLHVRKRFSEIRVELRAKFMKFVSIGPYVAALLPNSSDCRSLSRPKTLLAVLNTKGRHSFLTFRLTDFFSSFRWLQCAAGCRMGTKLPISTLFCWTGCLSAIEQHQSIDVLRAWGWCSCCAPLPRDVMIVTQMWRRRCIERTVLLFLSTFKVFVA